MIGLSDTNYHSEISNFNLSKNRVPYNLSLFPTYPNEAVIVKKY